ncbi:UNVERIFIED_CONTAM: hypothetical protein Sradi_4173000 [Sesamum radiatum]|uniref:Endonuclease/exonuclease/phosphatase domain-containing protein n=1 Tax=Sesamum radiatum TaxID=300843 RepID=A0AAW2P4J0_SESRA
MFGIDVESKGKSGGLMLLWNKSVVVHIRSYSIDYIDAKVHRKGEVDMWRFTGFYGNPDVSKRKKSWMQLVRLSQDRNLSWLCLGDFNEVLARIEKSGTPRSNWQIQNFRDALQQINLTDLGYTGYKYTWWNRRDSPYIVGARLDRATITDGTPCFQWLKFFTCR